MLLLQSHEVAEKRKQIFCWVQFQLLSISHCQPIPRFDFYNFSLFSSLILNIFKFFLYSWIEYFIHRENTAKKAPENGIFITMPQVIKWDLKEQMMAKRQFPLPFRMGWEPSNNDVWISASCLKTGAKTTDTVRFLIPLNKTPEDNG